MTDAIHFKALEKIVSGGQTGVDRAALDVALRQGLPHGGWCPRGRRAEDGPIDPRYQLTETDSPLYHIRTEKNVVDSQGTLILYRAPLTGGSELTRDLAHRLGRPCLLVDLTDSSEPTLRQYVSAIRLWLTAQRVAVLNVAGPRESTAPGIYDLAAELLRRLLADPVE